MARSAEMAASAPPALVKMLDSCAMMSRNTNKPPPNIVRVPVLYVATCETLLSLTFKRAASLLWVLTLRPCASKPSLNIGKKLRSNGVGS